MSLEAPISKISVKDDISTIVDQLASVQIDDKTETKSKPKKESDSKSRKGPPSGLSVEVNLISYAAWLHPPTSQFASADVTSEEILTTLTNILHIKADPSDIAQMISRNKLSKMVVTPYEDIRGPEPKPNLLCAISAILYDHLTSVTRHKEYSKSDPIKLLEDSLYKTFDIICPRNPLKKLMSNSREVVWELYACRPTSDSPLLLERTEGYNSNHGNIGMQFEKLIVTPNKRSYHRVYAVNKVTIGDVRIGLTGEIDGVNSSGRPIEIKSKPFWIDSPTDRLLATAVQSKLGNVDMIITGGFSSQKGVKNGPVTFETRSLSYKKFGEYCKYNLPERCLEDSYSYANRVLKHLLSSCTEIGTVYHIRGYGHVTTDYPYRSQRTFSAPVVRVCEPGEFEFPVSEATLLNCSRALIQYATLNASVSSSATEVVSLKQVEICEAGLKGDA